MTCTDRCDVGWARRKEGGVCMRQIKHRRAGGTLDAD